MTAAEQVTKQPAPFSFKGYGGILHFTSRFCERKACKVMQITQRQFLRLLEQKVYKINKNLCLLWCIMAVSFFY